MVSRHHAGYGTAVKPQGDGTPQTIAELITQLTTDAGAAPTALWSPESAYTDAGVTLATEQGVVQQINDAVGNGYHFDEDAADKGGVYMDARTDASTLVDMVAGYNATETTLTVDSGTVFSNNDVIINETTFEWMKITGTTATTITVDRGLQGAIAGTGIAGSDNQVLRRLRVGDGPFIMLRRNNADRWINQQALNAVTPNGWAANDGSMAFLGVIGDHVHDNASASENPAILASATSTATGRDLTFYTRMGTADYFAYAVPGGVGSNITPTGEDIQDEEARAYVGSFDSGVENYVQIDGDRSSLGTGSGTNTLTKKWVMNAGHGRYGTMLLSILVAWNVALTTAQADAVRDTLREYRGLAAI